MTSTFLGSLAMGLLAVAKKMLNVSVTYPGICKVGGFNTNNSTSDATLQCGLQDSREKEKRPRRVWSNSEKNGCAHRSNWPFVA